jgi:hypothetical protein
MRRAGFEPGIPAIKRPQTYALGSAATEIGDILYALSYSQGIDWEWKVGGSNSELCPLECFGVRNVVPSRSTTRNLFYLCSWSENRCQQRDSLRTEPGSIPGSGRAFSFTITSTLTARRSGVGYCK